MHALKYGPAALLLAIALAAPGRGVTPRAGKAATRLSMEEAKILAYLTPYGVAHRRVGLDVRVIAGDSPCLQAGWVSLDVVSSRPFPAGGGPENHQYVAVNLKTGQVYNPIPIPAEELSTPEMAGVAAIMRAAHNIDQEAYEKFSSEQPELKGPPPCR